MPEATEKDVWEKIKVLSAVITAIGVPLAVALIGNWYTESIETAAHANAAAIRDKETHAQFVELAIGILTADPTPENEGLRQWAVNIVKKHSGVPLPSPTAKALVKEVSLAGTVSRPTIDSVSSNIAGQIVVEGKNFGGLAGDVFVTPLDETDSSRHSLDVEDWETTRIKVGRKFRRDGTPEPIQDFHLFRFEVQSRDGRVSKPFP